ncbi:phosphoglucosamine mutase [Roseivirga pacifica]|uniref:phosphoglucosamine mutase n=1 Tax=Roseivirga pacifica TaxID=1267423 RepID=UPI0020956328|nr:phosphoglucosamine mutase [Roseivirga pacifica]MCO6359118.1 phosphoglucosamine mutase [Roseivirga pacifica]MCO6365246.1 phosphoglucosamine mutase [Roseivirga pacifica]MCO6372024.1 phosphoglucosamine mutase [Roseivirga pacifica]MCO6375865.1 phosphoglucosamine mutase [Roseivirga pacifica]MCO6379402.1 phosphoglucosamine mutase [Roseivirga pacifica]
MTLIKSISGIRGTIGGKVDEALTPIDAVKFAAAFGTWVKEKSGISKIVIGRDARPSGEMISNLVSSTLIGLGIDVIDLGLSTTPTVEMAVPAEGAGGGIILTASHNPVQWNALKLLNAKGEFISGDDGKEVLEIAKADKYTFAEVKKLGKISKNDTYIAKHIEEVLKLPLVDVEAIKKAKFKVVIDCVNSTGGISLPPLLKALGVEVIEELYCEPNGHFPHNPEPLPEHLGQICSVLEKGHHDLGIVVDPDVDRLCFIDENGVPFGEEYTLVAVADYILSKQKGNTVSNLSSTRALRDVTEKHGGTYQAAAVGEVNVVTKMKETNAVIGGEGNGGIIYPELHYGRDALVGIALFLTHLANFGKRVSMLRASYPNYFISKNKIDLSPDIDVDKVLVEMKERYKKQPINTIDGVKIEFDKEWVHLRKSNTEPIIRIYAESESHATADHLANKIIADIKEIVSN